MEIKHVLVVKFKESVSEEQIEDCIKQYGKLVDLIPSIKAFKWGKEIGMLNLNQGFTHVFESTFESVEDVIGFATNPHHTNYSSVLMPLVEKFVLLDFQPAKV
ncbi:stress-response A/B barrel domain-containing protein HS1-like [Salvia splendens]|uniref:stress-response A/B barrel domain-containing protein HS1-like n=1 Tax=Salvia splendens TaxID=180675 RepID=UPI001C2783B6|nr:stress-response A/B barrel domain-containing protein HS1-like [Salvia splendens]